MHAVPLLRAPENEAPAQAGASLDLLEGNSAARGSGCPRWPRDLRLQSTLGELVAGRCRATNLCDYCARMAARETAEMLQLDALEGGEAPAVWSVLTTRTPELDMGAFYRAREAVRRAVKRQWPTARWATMVEYTTGYGTRSGGHRRPHWNDVWKGVPEGDAPELHSVLSGAWCGRVDAEPDGQWTGTVGELGGLMRYLVLHFLKESQKPPEGWRGHRFRASRGYLWLPTQEAREAARWSLRFQNELRHARKRGLEGAAAEEAAQAAMYEAGETGWELVRLVQVPTAFSEHGDPCEWDELAVPVRAR